MGRMSGGKPGLSFTRAVGLHPARYCDTETGTFPDAIASKFTMSLRDDKMGYCRGTSAVSKRCCIRRPDSPHAVDFGKNLSTVMILKSLLRIGLLRVGGMGGDPFGCLD